MLVAPFKDVAVPPFDTWEKRFAWIQRYRGMSLSKLSLEAGLSRSTVGNAIRREQDFGKASFDADTIAKVAKAADVDVRWLTTGEGSPEPTQELALAQVDTWPLINEAAEMLVQADGLSLAEALLLLRDVRPSPPTLQGYYLAARSLLAQRASRDLGITKDFEQRLERELGGGAPAGPVTRNKRKQTS